MTVNAISRRALLATAGAFALPLALRAQTPKVDKVAPNGAIRIVASFPAGTGTDALLRLALPHLSESMGRTLIVDNKPGADGMIGATELLKSPVDGLTIMCASNTTMSGVPALKKNPPYDPRSSFEGISLLGFYTVYLYVSHDSPVGSVAEIVKYGQAHPGELSIGEAGFTHRIAAVKLAQIGGVKLTEVPYKGEPDLVGDILTNRIQLAFASPAVLMPYVKQGKLRAIATVMAQRTRAEPDIPTMAEAGLADFSGAGWSGIFGAKGFPQETKEKLSRAFASAFAQPSVVAFAEQTGFSIKASTPAQTDRFVADDIASTWSAARKAGIPLE